MARIAARLARWRERGSPVTVGLPGSGAVGGVPILQQQFGDTVRLVVEIAWGANLTADQSTWGWVDVTTDVQIENDSKFVTIRPGRADEASRTQPATASLTLDNRLGRYSKSALSPNWPNVRKNTPVRIRIIYLGVSYTRFFGYATSFSPSWDTTGNYATVALTANGTLRRENQGQEVLRSPLTRAYSASNAIGYWPMEDASNATILSSPLLNVFPMTFFGLSLASNTALVSSEPLPVFDTTGKGSILGVAPAYVATQYWELNYVQLWNQGAADVAILFVNTTGTYKRWEIVARGTGAALGLTVTLNVYDVNGAQTVLTNAGLGSFFFGQWTRIKLFVSESAGVLTWTLDALPATASGAGGFVSGTVAGVAGSLLSVTNAPDANRNGLALGHVALFNAASSPTASIDHATAAFVGESPTARIARLASEQGELVDIKSPGTSTATMGAQTVDTYINLLHACEMVDQGYLYDGFDQGLTYQPRGGRENALPLLTLNAAAQDLTPPFAPVDDDLLLGNKYTATRSGGSSAIVTDTADALGTNVIGTYSSGDTYNNQLDADLIQYAAWKVHLQGTSDTYRYPTLVFSIHRRTALLAAWLQTQLTTPVTVTNIQSALSTAPPEDINLVLQGYTEILGKFTWDVAVNGSPYDPWRITVLAADTGDGSTFLCRLETDGSHVVGANPAGSSSLTVVTPSGPLWTTTADDFPLYVTIGGLRVTVNSIASPNVSNGTFETGVTPWTVTGGALTQSSTQKHSGTFAAKIVPDGVTAIVGITSEKIPIVPGTSYAVTAWVWATSSITSNYSTAVSWFDAAGVSAGNSVALVSIPATTWTQVSSTFVAPATAATAAIVPLIEGTPAAAQIFYIDDVSMLGVTHQNLAVDGTTVLKQINDGDTITVWDETVLGL